MRAARTKKIAASHLALSIPILTMLLTLRAYAMNAKTRSNTAR
jgi:hypothetical protein